MEINIEFYIEYWRYSVVEPLFIQNIVLYRNKIIHWPVFYRLILNQKKNKQIDESIGGFNKWNLNQFAHQNNYKYHDVMCDIKAYRLNCTTLLEAIVMFPFGCERFTRCSGVMVS